MIHEIEYNIAYCLYQETKNMEDLLSVLDVKSSVVTESAELESLNESVKEVIISYANKVIEGIQTAWNKFKDKIANFFKDSLLKKYNVEDMKRAIADQSVEKVQVSNYKDYDLAKLVNINIKPLNYSSMQNSLESVDTYLKSNHSDFFKDSEKSVQDNMRTFITKSKSDKYTVSSEDMLKMLTYVNEGNKALVDQINGNIEQINNSTRNIEILVRNIASATPTSPTQKQESMFINPKDIMRYYFLEDGEEEKPKIVSDEKKETEGNTPQSNESESTKIRNAVQVYLKANSQMLSAQMSLTSEILSFYVKILNKYMSNWSKAGNKTEAQKKEAGENNNNPENEDNSSTIKQVK